MADESYVLWDDGRDVINERKACTVISTNKLFPSESDSSMRWPWYGNWKPLYIAMAARVRLGNSDIGTRTREFGVGGDISKQVAEKATNQMGIK